MTVIVLSLLCTPAATASKPPPAKGKIPKSAVYVVHGERCKSARKAVSHYRKLTWSRQAERGGELADRTPIVRGKTCRWARYAAREWKARAGAAFVRLQVWISERRLEDTPSWREAVRRVQRIFPNTARWLISCADAEGWSESTDTRWVIYGGRPYYAGAEHSYNGHLPQVGGPMQYMWGTFKGHYRRGLAYLRSRGYRVEAHLRDHSHVRAWRSMLAQAIAAGWARWSGNDNRHWSASWGRGC